MSDADQTRGPTTSPSAPSSAEQPTMLAASSPTAATVVSGRMAGGTTGEATVLADQATAATRISGDRTDATRVVAGAEPRPDPAKVLDGLVGRKVGGCTVEKLLGRGGMGAVFKARQESLHRSVALKVMLPAHGDDKQFADRFVREARVVAAINHPHVVQVYDAGADEDHRLYMVMEYVAGRTLGQLIRDQGALSPPLALELIRQSAEGLAAAHAKGLVHRDIKPDNLMVAEDARLKVMDFGLARPTEGGDSQLTMSGMILGTPNYISPEGARGEHTDIRSDIYSLGVTLWQAIAGRLPFTGPTPVQVMVQHLEAAPPDLALAKPECPPAVAALVTRMLAKKAEDRFSDPMALAEAIAELEFRLCGGPVRLRWNGERLITDAKVVNAGTPVPAAVESPRRGRWGLALALVAILALAVPAVLKRARAAQLPVEEPPTTALTTPGPAPTVVADPATPTTGGSTTPASPSDPAATLVPPPVAAVVPPTPAVVLDPPPTDPPVVPAVPPARLVEPGPVASPVVAVADPTPVVTPPTPPIPAVTDPGPTVVAPVPVPPVPVDRPATQLALTPLPAPVPVPVPTAVLPATLSVASVPTGAEIWVDGIKRGTTPALIRDLPAGSHEVRLVKSGHLDVAGTVILASGKVTRIANPLPRPATLLLQGIPPGTSVTVEGAPYTEGMLVPSGEVDLVVTGGDGSSAVHRVTLHPGSNGFRFE